MTGFDVERPNAGFEQGRCDPGVQAGGGRGSQQQLPAESTEAILKAADTLGLPATRDTTRATAAVVAEAKPEASDVRQERGRPEGDGALSGGAGDGGGADGERRL